MQDTGGRKVKDQASLFLIDVILILKFVVNVPSSWWLYKWCPPTNDDMTGNVTASDHAPEAAVVYRAREGAPPPTTPTLTFPLPARRCCHGL